VLSYPEYTAGRLMNPELVTVRADVTVDVVLRYLRMRAELPTNTNHVYVVSRRHQYLGRITLATLVTSDPEDLINELMDTTVAPISVEASDQDVAKEFADHDLISAPVVDDNNVLLGRITVDDVVDVIREEAEDTVRNMAGLSEDEDLFSPVRRSARSRAIWLGINLATAFLASWVIGNFEDTLEKVVALAVLMPIVASMGGVAGTQTLTLIVRGIALGQVASGNVQRLLNKELLVAALNGMLWALVVGVIAAAWFADPMIGVVIAAAMAINLMAAALAGVMIPILLKRMHIDPALAGGVVLTTVTDCVGFLAFLGLGTWLLLG
jgi:magnesium transporter